jgi:glycine/serine hydroxymethyltransferase
MKIVAKLIKEAIINKDNEEKLKDLRWEVWNLCKKFPIYR